MAKVIGTLVELAKFLSIELVSVLMKPRPSTRTRDRLSTSSFLRTSNRAACWRACLCREAISAGLMMLTASLAFQPFGSCSIACPSELLFFFEPLRFKVAGPAQISSRLGGLPRLIILSDSDWFRLCPRVRLCSGSLSSPLGVERSEATSFGAPVAAWPVDLSHGFGDSLWSAGAEIGVANVDVVVTVVAADLGVVKAAETGVKGVHTRGESSTRAPRVGPSTGVLPDRSRLLDIRLAKWGAMGFDVGMTSGVRLFGESGCRGSFSGRCSSSLLR